MSPLEESNSSSNGQQSDDPPLPKAPPTDLAEVEETKSLDLDELKDRILNAPTEDLKNKNREDGVVYYNKDLELLKHNSNHNLMEAIKKGFEWIAPFSVKVIVVVCLVIFIALSISLITLIGRQVVNIWNKPEVITAVLLWVGSNVVTFFLGKKGGKK